MLQTLKIFVIYLNILSYTDGTITVNYEYEREVEKEMLPFSEVIRFLEMEQPPKIIPLTRFSILGANLKSKLDMLARKSVDAQHAFKKVCEEKGGLETQKDKADMYQLLLGLTYRVDSLEKLLAPGEELQGKRSERWRYIFRKNTPIVNNFRNKIRAAKMTEVSFAEQVERLIQERNTRAAHANVPLPRFVKEKTIEGALRIMEITEDDKAVETVKILVAPVKGLDLYPKRRRFN